jgi:uncharacterized membrane protein YgcG
VSNADQGPAVSRPTLSAGFSLLVVVMTVVVVTVMMMAVMMVMAMMMMAVVPAMMPAMMPVMMTAMMVMAVMMMAVTIPHLDCFVLRGDRSGRQGRSAACGEARGQYDGGGDRGEDCFTKRHGSSFGFW